MHDHLQGGQHGRQREGRPRAADDVRWRTRTGAEGEGSLADDRQQLEPFVLHLTERERAERWPIG